MLVRLLTVSLLWGAACSARARDVHDSDRTGGDVVRHGQSREIIEDRFWGFGGSVDCNGNGIADASDIFRGRSKDKNHNGVPDECEEQSDGSRDAVELEAIEAGGLRVYASTGQSPVEIACSCPRNDRYTLAVLDSVRDEIEWVFRGRLRAGRYVFYWLPRSGRHVVVDGRKRVARLTAGRDTVEAVIIAPRDQETR